MRPIVVLRPEPGASATVRRAQALGLEAISIPLFTIETLAWSAPDPQSYDGLLLTSANAVRSAGSQLTRLASLPVYAVGPATAQAAQDLGLSVAATGNAGVDDLLAALPGELDLLHPCGEDRHAALSRHRITPVAVYRSAAIARPLGVERLIGGVALVHSPRAGLRLAEVAERKSSIAVAAISEAAAEACGAGWESISVADEPREESLLSLAARLCEQLTPQ